jgi:hypothetical protein
LLGSAGAGEQQEQQAQAEQQPAVRGAHHVTQSTSAA